MQNLKTLSTLRLTMFILGSVLALGLIWPALATAQDLEPNLTSQLVELQEQVARLEAALKQNSNGTASDTPAQSDPAGTQDTTSGGAPAGSRIRATHQNCLQCHQTRPSGPLPPSHLERLGGGAADGQGASSAGAGQAAMGQGGQGMGGGMGKGMMGGGMGMGMGKGKMGGGMGMGMGKGKMGGGMGMMGGGQAATGGSTTRTVDEQMQQMQQQMQQIMQMQMLQMRMMEMQLKMMKMMKMMK